MEAVILVVDPVPVGPRAPAGAEHVVVTEHVVEAHALDRLREVARLDRVQLEVGLREGDADTHRAILYHFCAGKSDRARRD